jgi:branched-chain amino acid transport system ATP-binding protein
MSSPLLEIDHLDSFYGDFHALFDVSLSIDAGQAVAVIGANGAGKSTLMRTICGDVPIGGGDIRFKGISLTGIPTYKRLRMGISLVPEGRKIFPSLSVDENLLIGAQSKRPGPWTKESVFEALPLLARISGRAANRLSGGEQQALAIGRSLMSNPELMLLDEVSLGLAPVVVKQIYETLPVVASHGTTMLIVEQDVNQALAASSHAYCLLEGRVSLHGPSAELSRDAITAAYFGLTSAQGGHH